MEAAGQLAYLIGLILCRKLLKVHIRPRIRLLLATVHRVTMLLNIDLICERFWVPMGPSHPDATFICVGAQNCELLCRAQNCELLAQYDS